MAFGWPNGWLGMGPAAAAVIHPSQNVGVTCGLGKSIAGLLTLTSPVTLLEDIVSHRPVVRVVSVIHIVNISDVVHVAFKEITTMCTKRSACIII